MKTSGRIIKNTMYLYIKMAITVLISLYTVRVFLNTLGASDYGLYTLISGVIFMFGFLQDSLSRATLRYLCVYKTSDDILNQKKVFSVSITLHLGIGLFIMVNLLLLTNFLFSGFLTIAVDRLEVAKLLYYLMIASFVFTVMSIPYDSILNANENMQLYSLVGIIESFLKLILALSLPYVNTDKLIFYSISLALITVISLIIKRIYCHIKYEECQFGFCFLDKKIAGNMISYAGWNFLTSISSLISFNSMPILLNKFFGTLLNAAQGIATQVNGVLSQFSSNMVKALNPTINKSSGGNEVDRMMKFGMTGSKLSFLILCFIAIPIILECPYILKLWLVNVPEWASIFCIILISRSLVNQLVVVYADCIYANSNIKNYCIIKSILNILPVPIVYIVFTMGAAPYMLYVVLFLFWELLGGIIILYYNRIMYNLDIVDYIKHLLLPCTIVLIFDLLVGSGISLIMNASFLRLLITILVTSLISLILSWTIILNKSEQNLVLEVIKNLIHIKDGSKFNRFS